MMNKIGATKSGTVLIEMTPAQYEALQKFSDSGSKLDSMPEQAVHQEAPAIALTRKLEFVRGCLDKLKPGDRDELLRSVKSVFRSFGGISESETRQIVHVLQKEGFVSISKSGEVRYGKDMEEAGAEETEEQGEQVEKAEEGVAERQPLVST